MGERCYIGKDELIETARAYIRHGTMAEAAKKIYVHEETMWYRLNVLEEFYGECFVRTKSGRRTPNLNENGLNMVGDVL